MTDSVIIRSYRLENGQLPVSGPRTTRPFPEREFLVTNGLGGYSSGTIGWVNMWRYHGVLISAEHTPLGRMMMLRQVAETLTLPDGTSFSLGGDGVQLDRPEAPLLEEFRLEDGLPVWRYKMDGLTVERALFMPHRQNATYLVYRLIDAPGPVRLDLRPYIQIRPHEQSNDLGIDVLSYESRIAGRRCEFGAGAGLPSLRIAIDGASFAFTSDGGARREVFFRHDAERGYNAGASSYTPGFFTLSLMAGQEAALLASTEPWQTVEAMNAAEALANEKARRARLINLAQGPARDIAPDLILAADQFLIEPVSRIRERVRVEALGDAVRAVIAGYHWFTDWGRDTLISLEGLTLVTGRTREARWILRSIGHYVRDGLIPNFFPDGADEGLYHTADASLWFFHALDRYLAATGDKETRDILLPKLEQIASAHLNGTRFGIGVDPADGLLRQGQEGYQLTWMDAKVDDWVVTPRRGKAVELNGLWYNALRLLAGWLEEAGRAEDAARWTAQADLVQTSFNARFWYDGGAYLYDIIDGENGNDTALRPNQLLSFSLRHKVLDEARQPDVLKAVQDHLLTPQGLRTLAAGHPDYKAQYFGDLRARDAAYHQGTVWPWLIGPFIDAYLTVHPDDTGTAHGFLKDFQASLDDACIGTLSEVADAEAPYTPRGCISQAWSVAEVLRCLVKTAPVAAAGTALAAE